LEHSKGPKPKVFENLKLSLGYWAMRPPKNLNPGFWFLLQFHQVTVLVELPSDVEEFVLALLML
jgi:hypothetical protein